MIPCTAGSRRCFWIFAGSLLLATFVVYSPAISGGLLWDDDAHVTAPELRSFAGLSRIWFDLAATQQYYPLLHSAFWVQAWLWGDDTTGYHVVNVLLHVVNSLVVLLVVRRLGGPPLAAALAAALFALHPVHVESVAWITELKNTLSGAFYLAALLVYLRFDASRDRRLYAAALALFVLGLLTKTVTATLPGALLVIFWWQRGRLSWQRDALPLLPWFALGAVSGLFTAWVEHEILGAKGAAYELSVVERLLLAGRVVWFYLGKLFWPAKLVFIYPRFDVDAGVWWQWLFPAAAVAVLVAAVLIRGRSRAPLASVLFFVGTLFPVLGFFNVFPFLYSFVADHFQYLASLGFIVPAAAVLARLLQRVKAPALAAVPLVVLALLSWRQAGMYADAATLYVTTIERNPGCWMAYNNLGMIVNDQGHTDEAITLYRRSIELYPRNAQAHNNLGVALYNVGTIGQAILSLERALELSPDNAEWLSNLGLALTRARRYREAIERHRQALALEPDQWGIRNNLAATYEEMGLHRDALREYRTAADAAVGEPLPRMSLARVHAKLGQFDESAREARRAIDLARAAGREDLAGEFARWLEGLRAGPRPAPLAP